MAGEDDPNVSLAEALVMVASFVLVLKGRQKSPTSSNETSL